MVRIVLFDFDGTLADTLAIGVASANRISREYGYREIEDVSIIREKRWRDVVREIGIPFYRIPGYARRLRATLRQSHKDARLFAGIDTIIAQLRETYEVGVMTSNAAEIVEGILRREGVSVDFVIGSVPLFRKHRALRLFLQERTIVAEDVIYVGDERRDIRACRRAGVRIIAVTWGFHAEASLRRESPDFLAHTPDEILRILRGL